MNKILKVLTLTALILCACSAHAWAAVKTYAVMPFNIDSIEQYRYMGVSVPQMISSRLYSKGNFHPIAKTTLAGQSAAGNESAAAQAQSSMNADYVIWGDMVIVEQDVNMNIYARGREGSVWSRSIRTKVHSLQPSVQEVSSIISREVFGFTPAYGAGVTAVSSQQKPKEVSPQMNPDLVMNEDGVRDVYLNPNIRYAGNTDDSGTLRTPTLPFPSVDFEVFDLDGDGRNEIVVLEEHAIGVYRFENNQMKELAREKIRLMDNLLSVRVYNDGTAKPKIIINAQDDREAANTYVYTFSGGKLKQEAKNIKYYMNVVKIPHQNRSVLVGQSGDVQRVFKGGIYEMIAAGNTYVEGTRMDMPEKVNALNFTWIPDREAVELLITLTPDERLRVFGKGGNRIFETEDKYSGSYVGIEQTAQIKGMGHDRNYIPDKYFIPQRMLVADLEGRGEYTILINKPISTAAQVFERYRFFPQGEIHALYWDGIGLNLKWKTRRIRGSVTNISLADFNNDGILDLVVGLNTHPGAVGISQRKTMLMAYPLDLNMADPNTPPDASEFIHN
ncbi:MAG: VCBS repeat-containing protein [Desulfovibrionaceae bacterium]|nr:VCBS repeat-containing protein [Desulfovibrionaceae bacterium]